MELYRCSRKGKIRFENEDAPKDIIRNITGKYEALESEAAFDKMPGEYVERMVEAIIGFTIDVSSIDNVFKLSQNQSETTRKSIINNLSKRGDEGSHLIAAEMEKRIKAS